MKLFEPPELDAESRAIIEAARGAHEPNELNRARVRKGLELKLAAAGLGLLIGSSSSALAGAVKATIAIAAVTTVVGAGVYVFPRSEPSPPAPRVAVQPRPAARAAVATVAEPPPPVPERPRRRAPAAPPRTDGAARLRAENALLGAANGALSRREVDRALALLNEYDRQIGPGLSGLLAEERTVTGILALCAAGRLEAARSEARHFRIRWPRSPLAPRVEGSCAGIEGASRSPVVR